MAYCGPRGIALDDFLRWPQASQDAALDWMAHDAARCGSCGTHPDEWNEAEGGSRHAAHAEVRICPGCRERERVASSTEYTDDDERGKRLVMVHGPAADCLRCLGLLQQRAADRLDHDDD